MKTSIKSIGLLATGKLEYLPKLRDFAHGLDPNKLVRHGVSSGVVKDLII